MSCWESQEGVVTIGIFELSFKVSEMSKDSSSLIRVWMFIAFLKGDDKRSWYGKYFCGIQHHKKHIFD